MKEYKAVTYSEGVLMSVIFGQGAIDPVALTNFINSNAEEGWEVVTMEKEIRRTLLFFKRESLVIIMQRPAGKVHTN